jgi:hypothetical protein
MSAVLRDLTREAWQMYKVTAYIWCIVGPLSVFEGFSGIVMREKKRF